MAENTPNVRFHEFRENWKCIKIDDAITEKKRPIALDDNTTYQLITVKRRNEGVVSRGFFKGKQILVKNYFEVEAGDYVISKRQVVHGANGIVPEKLDGAIVSNEYLVATENDNITTEFLTLISKLPDMYKKFFISSYGIDIEKLVFDVDDWKKRELFIPTTDEQKKISGFFSNFDKLYAKEQQKYDKLVNLKKSMLDKMFPKDGAYVPEVRFIDCDKKWQKGKLSECFNERQERSALGELISVTINSGIVKASELGRHDNSSANKSNYKKIEIGDIAYNSMRMWQGASGYSKYCGIVSPAYTVIIPQKDISPVFFSYVFKRPQMIHTFQIRSQGITSDTWNLKYPAFSEIEVKYPGIREQNKIGEFFENLDKLISLQNQKLQKLFNIKKAILEKMFL
ncbi:MAG: hsdS [Firmicutes bacterium]|nr:hsdS [Bacillota bacterium]